MSELLDVVSKYDEPTGEQVDIDVAHKEHIPHRVSAVLVFRQNGKLLVQVHKHYGRRLDHSVGGHVSAGEDYLSAAKRELNEELGIDLPIKPVLEGILSEEYYPKTGEGNTHMFGLFTAVVPDDWQLEETEEVDELRDMDLDEVVDQMNQNPDIFLQGFLSTMGAYLKSIGSSKKIFAYNKIWGDL